MTRREVDGDDIWTGWQGVSRDSLSPSEYLTRRRRRFSIVVADRSAARSIVVFKQDEDKVMVLDKSKLLGTSGNTCDSTRFSEFIQKNMALYEIRSGLKLSTHATANYIRKSLAEALRKGAIQTNLLLGGVDDEKASLYYLDYLGSSNKINYGCHGHVSSFVLSILDRDWKKDMEFDEAIQLVNKCIAEIQMRFLVQQPKFMIKVVDKEGVRVVSQEA